MQTLVSADFFVVPTITFRVLFVLVILSHDRRRPIHFAVTAHRASEWTPRQLLEAFRKLADSTTATSGARPSLLGSVLC